jgi:hypothetical protein
VFEVGVLFIKCLSKKKLTNPNPKTVPHMAIDFATPCLSNTVFTIVVPNNDVEYL